VLAGVPPGKRTVVAGIGTVVAGDGGEREREREREMGMAMV